MFRVLGASGSLRAGSSNTGLLHRAQRLAPPELSIEIYDGLGQLPFYNPDSDEPAVVPAEAARWREAVRSADGLLFAMSEYNFGPSGVMKNAIDWISRPLPDYPMRDKVMAIMTSAGKRGGPRVQAWAHEILPLLGVHIVNDPEVSLASGAEYVSVDGTTTNPEVEQLVGERLANMLTELKL